LTSQAARHFASLQTVIIDEIHALCRPSVARTVSCRSNGSRRCAPAGRRCSASVFRRRSARSTKPHGLLGGNFIEPVRTTFANGPVEVVDARMPPRLHVEVRAAARATGDVAVPNDAALTAPPAAASPKSNWPEIHAPALAG